MRQAGASHHYLLYAHILDRNLYINPLVVILDHIWHFALD